MFKTFIPSQPDRDSTPSPSVSAPTPMLPEPTLKRSGGVVIYELGRPRQKTQATDAREPNVTQPALGPLSREQKGKICIAAARAYKFVQPSMKLEEWRRMEYMKSDAKVHRLTVANQGHFNDLMEHFLSMLPDEDSAEGSFDHGMKKGAEVALKQRAIAKVKEVCARGEFAYPQYPDVIAKSKFKRPLESCSSKQIWCVFYDMTSRDRSKNGPRPKIAARAEVRGPRKSTLTIPERDDADSDYPF